MFSEESLKRLSEIRNRILYIFELCKEDSNSLQSIRLAYKDFGIFQLPQMHECTLVNRPLK